MNGQIEEKIVAVVDLSRYSDICKTLEQQLDVTAVAAVNKQIKDLISLALAAAGISSDRLPYKGTGDGAIIILDTADQGSLFAERLQLDAQRHNLNKDVPLAQRHFRIGVSTGKIILQRLDHVTRRPLGFDFAGTVIANAVRLEGACKTGEVLVSSDTWANLPQEVRKLYGPEEIVKGKRDESFRAHRRRVTPPAPWDAGPESADVKHMSELQGTQSIELLAIHKRRLDILEQQAAMYGSLTPPHITMEIEDIRCIISDIESS
jgi:hypothetical protein